MEASYIDNAVTGLCVYAFAVAVIAALVFVWKTRKKK